jgi:hypothetical protein
VALFSSVNARKIKHLNENILWTTDRHDGALVHYVTVYVPPNNEAMAEITTRQLKYVLYRIFLIDRESKVVVAGDLNKLGMKKIRFITDHFHLTAALG